MNNHIPFDIVHEKAFTDIPGSTPRILYPLQKVGITNRPHYMTVLDPFTNQVTRLFAYLTVFFNLPAQQRGLHMSRIERCLHRMEDTAPVSLQEYIFHLSQILRETQQQDTCEINIVAHYEKSVDKNISKRPSYELLQFHVSLLSVGQSNTYKIGVTAPIINACPCAQRWGMKEFYYALKQRNLPKADIEELVALAPKQSHTNRGDATIIIHSSEITIRELYTVIEHSSPIVRELLSGEDEHSVVKEAQKYGMFCEDVVREIVYNLVKDFEGKLSPHTWIEIKVDVDESVHFHNLYAEVKETFAEMKEKLV